ncbi:MAG: hypothetical protein AB8B59_03885 [Maribacter sp.]
MKIPSRIISDLSVFILFCSCAIGIQGCNQKAANLEKVALLDKKLNELEAKSDNQFFSAHFKSIRQVINEEQSISKEEANLLDKMYDVFLNDSLTNPSDFSSYLERKRSLILAWTSPTDGTVSLSWLKLPKNWDPKKTYPLYVELHGYWDVASKPISFLSHTFIKRPSTTAAFEDGYLLSPWGRGNKRYHGISKIDVWESIAELEKMTKINPERKYLLGHSMGGYGTWHIAQESDSVWAAIGILSGSLFYEKSKYITPEYANKLKNTPTYFAWGNKEDQVMTESNKKAHNLLRDVGNQNTVTAVFDGGHDYDEVNVEKMYNWLRTFKKTIE